MPQARALNQTLRIRHATPSDKEAVQHVYYCLVGPPTGQEVVWERLIVEKTLLVAEMDGMVVGFGGIDLYAEEQLKWLYVLPERQGSGVGAKMLHELEQVAWENGLTAIRLHSAPAAEMFYRRHGYEAVDAGQRVQHDHEGVEMSKHL